MIHSLQHLISLVDNLQKDAKPLWGKMSSQHMVEHLVYSLQISNGKLNVGCFIPKERWATMKKILLSDRPLPKNFINPIIGEDLPSLIHTSLNESIDVLKKEYSDYLQYYRLHPEATQLNPTFGELNGVEWEVFHQKHFAHHFEQFGLL